MKSNSIIMLSVPGPDGQTKKVAANLLLFDEPKHNCKSIYVYLFSVSGKMRRTRDEVRWEIKKPGDKHIYFSKIETALLYPENTDPDKYIEKCKKMLEEAIPVLVNEHFPTVDQVKRR